MPNIPAKAQHHASTYDPLAVFLVPERISHKPIQECDAWGRIAPKAQCLYCRASAGFHSEDADTILDAVFWVYSEATCADGPTVLQYNENLNRLLYGLPAERVNTIIGTVNDLCWEHDRQGFINGFKLEMRPEQEILQ